uniref:DUF1758 domain-containing protein n=1 Tax=Heterorhabditis bacteriophora TaxID=37862 RepID=A0A1I7W7R7_HETBA
MVHTNTAFSPVEKFIYLTNLNLEIKEIMKPVSCRQTFENSQTLIQQLKSVDRDVTEEDDPLWKQLLYKKFPAIIRKQVFLNMQEKSSISWTVNQMLNNISNLISSTEMYEEDGIRSFVSEPRYTNRMNRTDRGTKCLSNNHTSRQCARADCPQCGRDHHRLLCLRDNSVTAHPNNTRNNISAQVRPINEQRRMSASKNNSVINNSIGLQDTTHSNLSHRQRILMTADAEVWNYNTQQYERSMILFDNDTQITLSGLECCTERFNSKTASTRFRTITGQILEVQLSFKPLISNEFESATISKHDSQFLEKLNIALSNPRTSGEMIQPVILIGVDLWVESIKVAYAITITPSGLVLQPIIFGNAIHGCGKMAQTDNGKVEYIHSLAVIKEKDSVIRKELNRIYSLEGLGISDDPTNQEDET